jgi:peptidoglycan glycosyltransferase
MMILFGLLFVNLNWIQVYKADAYRTDDVNNRIRLQQAEYDRQRGLIVVDGVPVADSVATGDTLKYLRRYPSGPEYASVVGYRPVDLAAVGIERLENDFLAGTGPAQEGDRFLEAITGKEARGGNVVLTIRKQVQDAAYKALLNNPSTKVGSVVALDPTTGAVLAMVSTPTYDPNPLVSHDDNVANAAFAKLDQDPTQPLLNRAVSETYPPGSTFKTIVSAAALTYAGLQPNTVLTGGDSYPLPGTSAEIHNEAGVVCPDKITLQQALTVSCNTAFARLGVEQVKADNLKKMAQAFGFEDVPNFTEDKDNNYMRVVASHTGAIENPDGSTDEAALAQSCIGQREVRMTPLQAALIASTIANNGTQMRPYLIDRLQYADLTEYSRGAPEIKATPITPDVATKMQQMMDNVVAQGTGTRAQIAGYEVGGKTGTAQNGDAPEHGWFIGYARNLGDGKPLVAVAVFLANTGDVGSSQATAIAGQVMRAAIEAGKVK